MSGLADPPAALAAAALAAAAAWWAVGPSPSPTKRWARRGPSRTGAAQGRGVIGVAAVVGTVAVALVPAEHLVLAAVLGGAGAGAMTLVARRRVDAQVQRRRERLVGLSEALLGGLRAGQPPSSALERAAVRWPEVAPAAATARLGGEVADALREAARTRGAEGLARLASAWELSAMSGAGLVLAVEQMLETARAEQAARQRVQAEVASARATARVVAVLPVVVLVASDGMGAEPWSFLLGTLPGVLCLAVGLGLGLAGLAWVDRIARAAVGGP